MLLYGFIKLLLICSTCMAINLSLFCKNDYKVPDWYCDKESAIPEPEFTRACKEQVNCPIYQYCVKWKWCIYYQHLENDSPIDVADLVIIADTKSVPRCLIKNLPKLVAIHGVNADIRVVEPWAFWNLPKLEDINLSYNSIRIVEYGVFSELSSVKFLDLSWNLIDYIGRGSFQNMMQLVKLDLSGNYILELDVAYNFFLKASNTALPLEELYLSHNNLRDIRNLNIFPSLSVLNLAYNKIGDLNFTSNFHPSQSIKKLDLSGNYLREFFASWHNMVIELLRIPFNSLSHPSNIQIDATVKYVVLDGNPWQCESFNQVLENFILSGTTILNHYEDDEDIYFLSKQERENYPSCYISQNRDKIRDFQELENSYKLTKHPPCEISENCPGNMTCKSGSCWMPCKQNVCHEVATCINLYHGFYCACPNTKLSKVSSCYNVN